MLLGSFLAKHSEFKLKNVYTIFMQYIVILVIIGEQDTTRGVPI